MPTSDFKLVFSGFHHYLISSFSSSSLSFRAGSTNSLSFSTDTLSLTTKALAIDTLCEYGFEAVWLVGEEFAKTKHPATFRTFADVTEAKESIKVSKPEGFTILIKGSNSTKLVQLAELL